MNYDTPLRWEHEDGRTGTEVCEIPHEGMVFFYDTVGPIARMGDIAEARWWVMHKMREDRPAVVFRVTRLTDGDGVQHYIIPNLGMVDCDDSHPCKGKHPCVVVDDMCNRLLEALR